MSDDLRASPVDASAVVAALDQAVLVIGVDREVRLANPAAERLLGVDPGALVGRDLTSLLPPRLRAAGVADFVRCVTAGSPGRCGPVRFALVRGDGTEVAADVTLAAAGELDEPGASVLAILRAHEGPDHDAVVGGAGGRSDAGAIALLAEASAVLQAGGPEPHDALRALVPWLCDRLGWGLATLWLVRPGEERTTCVDVWTVGQLPGNALGAASRNLALGKGECLPGACWSTGDPVVTSVDDATLRLSRKAAARADGLRQALAFPLTGSAGAVGFVEFFRTAAGRVTPDVLALLAALGRVAGQFIDRARAQQELRYRSALLTTQLDTANDGVLAVSPDGRVLAVNRRFCELWRLPLDRVSVGDEAAPVLDACRERAVDPVPFDAGVAWSADDSARTTRFDVTLKDGRVVAGYAAPLRGPDGEALGRVWHLRDDTDRRTAEAYRADLESRLETAERLQDFLLRASDVLAGAADYAETLERLAEVAVPTLGDLCLIDVLDESGRLVRMTARHADRERQPLADELRQAYAPDPHGRHPAVAAIGRREPHWSPEMSDDYLRATTRDEHHFELVKALDFTSFVTVPLVAEEQALGSVTLVSAGSGRRFGAADAAIAEELARRVALVVAKARRYEREHHISHALQASLLPATLPPVPGLSIAVRYLPGTRNADVGGDFYDVIPLASGEVAVMVGDVAGHDVTAAATMGQLRSANRALIGHAAGPAGLIALLHDSWAALGLDRMATVLYLGVRPDDGALRLASAGHLPPVVLQGGRATFVDVEPGGPLGAPRTDAVDWHGTLPVGGVLLCFTDGLVEDRSSDIDVGMAALLAAVEDAATTDPDTLCDAVLATMAGDVRGDDVALLAVRRDGG